MARHAYTTRKTTVAPTSSAHGLRNVQYIIYVLVAAATLYGIIASAIDWWVCDDAFISFRYARNLVDGHGLVFNIGERVEGYSNFLWTIIMAAGMLVKIDPVPLSVALGILSYVVLAGTFAVVSRLLFFDKKRPGAVCLPITAILLLLHHDMHVFATSGLETMWTAALVALGFALTLFASNTRTYILAGLVLVVAALSRPDALLYYLVSVPFVFVTAQQRWKALASFVLPLLAIYVPYWIIRYNYYGWPFPNTYYAKSAGMTYYSQGWTYLWLYVKSYYVLLLALPAVVLLLWRYRHELPRLGAASPIARATVLALLFAVPYMAYIVRMGGDFMFARFWIVVTAFLFFLLEAAARAIIKRPAVLAGVTVVLAAAVFLRIDLYRSDPKQQISGIANEPAYYPQERHSQARDEGLKLKKYLKGKEVQVAFRGMYAMQVYYSELPVAIEAATGLTDEYIAHQPITERGRPGHEKTAPVGYLDQRGVDFLLKGMSAPRTISDSLNLVFFDGYPVVVVQWDAALMNSLKQYPEVSFTDIPAWLDQNRAQLQSLSQDAIYGAYQYFYELYFRQNPDPQREQYFLKALQSAPSLQQNP